MLTEASKISIACHECITNCPTLNGCFEDCHSLLPFFPSTPFENFMAVCRRAWLLSSVADAANSRKKKKRHKNDTACKYVLPMETQNKLKQTQLADCLFILHHSRARGFSNHYLGCSWNTKHFLQKYCVEISLKRITILYQTITETLQSALFGFDFSVKIQ